MTAYAADSHPGHKRGHNEDRLLAEPGIGLYLVADGVGGHAHGEIAAAIVRDTLRDDIVAGDELVAAIHHAHERVLQEISRRADGSNMGSTVVAALLKGRDFEIAWVGDSRAYRFDGQLSQLTRDHNPVSEMLARGALTPEQAASHPERNVLSQSLGVSDAINVAPGRIRGQLAEGDQLLLCSDGLTDELSDLAIATIMAREPDADAQLHALIQAALDAGGRDNVSVVLVGAKASATATAEHRQDTLNHLPVAVPEPEENAHDRKVWLLMGLMGVLAVLFVTLVLV